MEATFLVRYICHSLIDGTFLNPLYKIILLGKCLMHGSTSCSFVQSNLVPYLSLRIYLEVLDIHIRQ